MPAIQLGPFALQRPIGKGGMGEVWRGYHLEQDVPVAVKVMTAKVYQDPANHDRFRNEVRAVARLDHPGVVWVFDHGEVDERAAKASSGRLVAGSPYLAMEFAGNGTLHEIRRALPWPELQTILLNLLDALAHAHAMGVVHRDLKPGNVLICGPRDLRPGLKLTDFGIAHADSPVDSHTDEVVGTLHYMAPEQIRGAMWAQGPHTDLYALGCMAWRLACHTAPFTGRTGVELLAAQLHQPLPRLRPVAEVPADLQTWIDTLTAKAPADRFRCAADAAQALLAIEERTGSTTLAAVPSVIEEEPATEPSIGPADTRFLEMDATVLTVPAMDGEISGPIHTTSLPLTRPKLPESWRRAKPSRRLLPLVGAGLRLYGVRTIPMVGRERERDALWEELRTLHATRSARVVVIRGPAGTGKSRLAEWLCERAHEVGAAKVLRARFSENDALEEPLRRMLSRELRIGREARGQSEETQAEVLDGWLQFWGTRRDGVLDALEALVRPTGAVDAQSRHALLRMIIEEIARERPAIVWLDDVQWGQDGLEFVQSVLDAGAVRPVPALLVLTVRDEALKGDPEELLDQLTRRPETRTLPLKPLGRADRARLVQELLGLEPALGAEVEERSGGNPLFAVQLVGDWVQRGLLIPGERGFRLAPGVAVQVPDSLTGVWGERIEQLLDGLPPDARWILERAAVLGHDVDLGEWQTVCDDPAGHHQALGRTYVQSAHAEIRHDLVERLLARRLAEATATGWVFGHGLLQETLRTDARRFGRWREHNRACARMIALRVSEDSAERLGRHLLEAFEVDRAIAPLLRGVRHRRLTVGTRSALSLIRTVELAMRTRLRPHEPQWAELFAEKAATLYHLGQVSEADAVSHHLLRLAEEHGWVTAARSAAFRLGRIAMDAGDLDAATKWLDRAVDSELPTERAEALFFRSRIATLRLEKDEAKRLEDLAVRALERSTDRRARILSELFVTEAAWDDEDMEKCGRHAAKALELATEVGDLVVQMRSRNFLAESARAAGDLDAAVDHLSRGIQIAQTIGHARAPVLQCNLALVHMLRQDWDAADHELQEAQFHARQLGQAPMLSAVFTFRMQAAAGAGNWSAFDDHATAAERVQFELPMGELDSARSATTAGELALHAEHGPRARRAWQLALDHWTKLGKRRAATELRARIAALS